MENKGSWEHNKLNICIMRTEILAKNKAKDVFCFLKIENVAYKQHMMETWHISVPLFNASSPSPPIGYFVETRNCVSGEK